MGVVYVILEREGKKAEYRPVGVVSSETVANAFYVKDSENRDWISFTLDELPENMQQMPPLPPDASAEQINDTRSKVEKTTQDMQQLLKGLRDKRKVKRV